MNTRAQPITVDETLTLRKAFGAYPTGVTVVTTIDPQAGPIGLTCNSFASVSLSPPLISWSIIKGSSRAKYFMEAKHFAVSILGAHQASIAQGFAKSATEGFQNTAHYPADSNCPMIAGAAAVLDCQTYATYELGDHIMFIGYVTSHSRFDAEPLVFFGGQFGSLAG